MFTAEFRDQVRNRVLELVRVDPRVTGGALTGSTAIGLGDKWSAGDDAVPQAPGVGTDPLCQPPAQSAGACP